MSQSSLRRTKEFVASFGIPLSHPPFSLIFCQGRDFQTVLGSRPGLKSNVQAQGFSSQALVGRALSCSVKSRNPGVHDSGMQSTKPRCKKGVMSRQPEERRYEPSPQLSGCHGCCKNRVGRKASKATRSMSASSHVVMAQLT